MSLNNIRRGRHFKIANYHPAFILTEPFKLQNKEGQYVIYANASSVENHRGIKRRNIDETCILKKGDHHSIENDSYIIYDEAECISTKELQNAMKKNQGQNVILAHKILMKICKGLMQSTRSNDDVKDAYRQAVKQGRAYKVF